MNIPLHPLVIHVVVIFLTVVPLLVLVSLVWRGLRDRLDWLLPAAALVGGIAAVVAEKTGEILQHSLPSTPLIRDHAEIADKVAPIGMLFALITIGWWLTQSKVADAWVDSKAPWLHAPGLKTAATVVVAIASVAVIVVVILAGHSGATAVWTTP